MVLLSHYGMAVVTANVLGRVSGALLGTTPEQAFFVRCDRSRR